MIPEPTLQFEQRFLKWDDLYMSLCDWAVRAGYTYKWARGTGNDERRVTLVCGGDGTKAACPHSVRLTRDSKWNIEILDPNHSHDAIRTASSLADFTSVVKREILDTAVPLDDETIKSLSVTDSNRVPDEKGYSALRGYWKRNRPSVSDTSSPADNGPGSSSTLTPSSDTEAMLELGRVNELWPQEVATNPARYSPLFASDNIPRVHTSFVTTEFLRQHVLGPEGQPVVVYGGPLPGQSLPPADPAKLVALYGPSADEDMHIATTCAKRKDGTRFQYRKWMTFPEVVDVWGRDDPDHCVNLLSCDAPEGSLLYESITPPAAIAKLALQVPDGPEPVFRGVVVSSPGACTEVHFDLSGAAVVASMLEGEKDWFLAPSTPENIRAFEHWKVTPNAWIGDLFVPKFRKVRLRAGETMILPSGTFHGVHTVTKSLMIGGAFLHDCDWAKQIQMRHLDKKSDRKDEVYPGFDDIARDAGKRALEGDPNFNIHDRHALGLYLACRKKDDESNRVGRALLDLCRSAPPS